MYAADKSGFKKFLTSFDKQIQESEKLFRQSDVELEAKRIRNIVYLGMGGSAMAGDLLHDILFDSLKVPVTVSRAYLRPNYCDRHTLIIACSYSGNTEETLSALEDAADSGAQILCVTSGGTMKDKALEAKWPLIRIPEGYPPRQALGYMLFSVYHVLGSLKLIESYEPKLNSLARFAREWIQRNDHLEAGQHILSRDIAHTLRDKIPVIYSTAPFLKNMGIRWQNQFQENSKSLAFANQLPEMNHNEIVGWELESKCMSGLVVILLEREDVDPRVKKRLALTKKIIQKRGTEVIDIFSRGKTLLEHLVYLIILGDWISYYLALLYKKDPMNIKNIDFLKKELARLSG